MATEASLINSVRVLLGDTAGEPFRDSFRGSGDQNDYNLSANNVNTIEVFEIGGDDSITNYTENVDFVLDRPNGIITFTTPPAEDALIMVEGTSYAIFTEDELTQFLDAAVSQHLNNRTVQRRYKDGNGFIRYDRKQMELADLPKKEEFLVTLLATIESLWALATDAATDIDVTTSEGTHVPRGQRWRQLTAQIDVLTEKYNTMSLAMGVGLLAPEVLDQRRVSKTTGRLVPVFEEREYDEVGPPIRKLPPRGNRDEDPDGPWSPWWSGGWGF